MGAAGIDWCINSTDREIEEAGGIRGLKDKLRIRYITGEICSG